MSNSQFIIRAVESADLTNLAAFIEPFVREGRLLPRTTDELSDLLQNGFVAEANGRLVGFAALEIYSKKLAEIRSLAVDSSMQGQGVGSQLVNRCVERARERDVLEVMAVTSADEFFMKSGFDFTLPGEKKALFIRTTNDASDSR